MSSTVSNDRKMCLRLSAENDAALTVLCADARCTKTQMLNDMIADAINTDRFRAAVQRLSETAVKQ